MIRGAFIGAPAGELWRAFIRGTNWDGFVSGPWFCFAYPTAGDYFAALTLDGERWGDA